MKLHLLLAVAIALAWSGNAVLLHAQEDEDVFGNDVDAAAAAPPAAAAEPATELDLSIDGQAVQAVLATDPTTASELVQAITIIIDLKRPAAAAPLVQKLAALNLSAEDQIKLHQEFGSATFLKFSLTNGLDPAARTFADGVMKAADQHARDPQRLAELIARLQDPTPSVREAAASQLREGQEVAIAALLTVLADANRAEEHMAVRGALAGFGRGALGPLLAAVQFAEPGLQAQAIQTVARLNDTDSALYLFAPALAPDADQQPAVQQAATAALQRLLRKVPSRASAAAALLSKGQSYFDHPETFPVGSGTSVSVWHWDAEKQQPIKREATPEQAAMETAARLARQAYRLYPENIDARRLYYTSLLESAVFQNGFEQPLSIEPGTPAGNAATLGIDAVEDLYLHATKTDHIGAAVAAVTIMGELEGLEALYRRAPQPSVLVSAVEHPARRVRFAALAAIMKMQPVEAYPGSSKVAEALAYFATSLGMPRAIVADPRAEEARRMAGLLSEMGYDAEIATNPNGLVRLAIESPDFEVLLVDMYLASPTSGELLTRLRRDSRTARMPIGVVSSPEDLLRAEKLARKFSLVGVFVRPQDVAGMEFQYKDLMAKLGREAVPSTERQQQTAQALRWLADIAKAQAGDRQPDLYDVQRLEAAVSQSIYVEALAADAATVLAHVGTPSSQRLLVAIASQGNQPLEMRRAAAHAFRDSVARHGTLLTSREIRQQYDRYNQSELLGEETQQVLASILDGIEARAAAVQELQE